MRALTISAHGGLDRIEPRDDLPTPEIRSAAEVRVRVRAAAINHLDVFVVGGLPGVTITPPWILGTDACGVVDQAGADVRHVRVGDRVVINPGISDRSCEYCLAGEHPLCVRFAVLGEHVPGTIAEHVVVPAVNVRAIPAAIGDEEAAAFTLATLTAWRMVHSRARVTAGDTVLIWGIGGGVAQAALRICKQVGAEVWVTSSDEGKLRRARDLGADHVLNHRQVEVGKAIRQQTGKRGVTVVIDNVGEATWTQSLIALGRGGRLVTCGGTSGPMLTTDVRRLFWNQWSIMGSTMGNEAEFDAVVAELSAGRLRPVVDAVYPMAGGRAAFERMAAGAQFGKIVITVP
ncbi:MAG TPA: zinc-binding dehydrogenase [Gemmatimonadaceae bacterium]|nr:zinc-binding dehydrogenase [Gemmatimonadaceae bacterium]